MSLTKRDIDLYTVSCFNQGKIAARKRQLPAVEDLESAANRHKAMGHPVRMAILHLLAEEECCVRDLANILNQPVSTVSQHLKTLKYAGLVGSCQHGKLVFYCQTSPKVLKRHGRGAQAPMGK